MLYWRYAPGTCRLILSSCGCQIGKKRKMDMDMDINTEVRSAPFLHLRGKYTNPSQFISAILRVFLKSPACLKIYSRDYFLIRGWVCMLVLHPAWHEFTKTVICS